jgi:N-acyl-D-aspartate/D-glutamate deacylase
MRAETRLGRLAAGYLADLVVVDRERACWPWAAPEAGPLDLLVYRAQAGDVDTVVVGGQVVVRDGRPCLFDVEAVGRELAGRLAATPFPGQAVDHAERLLPYLEAYYRGWDRGRPAPYTAYNSRC